MSSVALQPPREPKYYTVKRHLLAIIESLEPDSAVPTERVLSAELGTSRTTVRQALLELVAEGRLVRRQGSGTYVAEPKMTWPLHLTSFTAQAAANGFTASTQLISAERIRADEDVATRLAIVIGAPVFRIERLRLADERPMAVEIAHLSAARFPQLTRHIRRAQSLTPSSARCTASCRSMRRNPSRPHRHRPARPPCCTPTPERRCWCLAGNRSTHRGRPWSGLRAGIGATASRSSPT